jgi:nucleotide-binding universal stress UspA family protein
MKILLAVDGSNYSKKMLAYLANHESLLSPKNEYTVLTVQMALPVRARAAVGKELVDKYHADEAEKVLAPVDKFLQRHKINAKGMFKVGHPGALIAQTADKGEFDLVVMGSHGHSALGNLVMGSVATNVLAHCKTPVLLVR